jgi:hypothetical protein
VENTGAANIPQHNVTPHPIWKNTHRGNSTGLLGVRAYKALITSEALARRLALVRLLPLVPDNRKG